MKKGKKILGLLLCMVFFAAIALGSGSSDEDSSSAKKVGEVEVSSTEQTDTKSDSAKADETDKKDSKQAEVEIPSEYRVGETLDYKGLKLTYVNSSNYTSDNQFMQPAEGKKYIRLFFFADNQSGSDQSVSIYEFKCYADGYDCSATYFDDDISLSLSNGRTGEGAIYFEVPVDATEVEVEYEPNMFSETKYKFIFEGDKDSGFVGEKNTAASEDAFHVGDVIETKNLKISYLKAEEYVSDNMFMQPAEGNKYIYIELEFENLSESDHNVSYFSFECYADGANCSGYYGMDDALSATLSAGRKAKGTVAFEVPKDASVIEIEYEDNVWTGDKIIFAY